MTERINPLAGPSAEAARSSFDALEKLGVPVPLNRLPDAAREEALSREQVQRLDLRSVACGPYNRDVEAFADLRNRVVVPAEA